jgi:signal peptidase I
MQTNALKVIGIVSALSLCDRYVVSANFTSGPSMYPTIPLFSLILFYPNPSRFGKGDVVVCSNPIKSNGFILKRITAVAGETVSLEPGSVLIPRGHVRSFISNFKDLAGRRRRNTTFT